MSQHHLTTSTVGRKRVKLVIGWDNPLHCFFATVFDLDNDEDVVFDTRGINYPGPSNPNNLEDLLEYHILPLGITVPHEMAFELMVEAEAGGSNRTIVWSPNGEQLEVYGA